jgi:hypothetical protein
MSLLKIFENFNMSISPHTRTLEKILFYSLYDKLV